MDWNDFYRVILQASLVRRRARGLRSRARAHIQPPRLDPVPGLPDIECRRTCCDIDACLGSQSRAGHRWLRRGPGTQPGVHPYSRNVGNAISQQVDGLADGTTYYFVATAYNTAGLMSLPSAEVSGQTSGGGGCTTCGAGPDLNGDSTPDLVWQNDSTRQVAVWYSGWSARKYLSRLGLAFVRLD